MRINLAMFGQDVLKVLSVLTIVAKAAEPVVDLSNPGIAQIYNLSADEGVAVISSFLGLGQSAPAAPAAPAVVAPAAAPVVVAPAAPAADPAPAPVTAEAATVKPGPGLSNVVAA